MWEKSSLPESGLIHAAVFEAGWAQYDLRGFHIPLALEEPSLHQRRDAAAGHAGVVGDGGGVDIPLVKLLPSPDYYCELA